MMVSLSVTEAEGTARVMCPQDMLYTIQEIKLLGINVDKLMVLEMDNEGAVGLANS